MPPTVFRPAMVLLGINAGFGNVDCATLPLSALDLDAGIIDFPTPASPSKTASVELSVRFLIERRAQLSR